MSNLENKIIVLTGASGGIGSEIAKKLASHNAKLILLGGRNKEKLNELCSEIKNQTHNTPYAVSGDITDLDFLDKAIKEITEKFNGVDILINNAGIAHHNAFEEVNEKTFDDIMKLDVKAPFFLIQKMLPILKQSDYATIVNIASVVGHIGYPYQSVYSAAKHALIGFTQSLAKEVYKDNIRVHLISPGGVYTDMIKLTRPDLKPDGMIMPTDISNIIEFLLENRTNAMIDEICLHRIGKEPF